VDAKKIMGTSKYNVGDRIAVVRGTYRSQHGRVVRFTFLMVEIKLDDGKVVMVRQSRVVRDDRVTIEDQVIGLRVNQSSVLVEMEMELRRLKAGVAA